MDSRLLKMQGAFLGVHAGDALGAGVEFSTRHAIMMRYPQGVTEITGGGVFAWHAGDATDDTDMTLALARGYIKTPQGGLALVHSVADYFVKWLDNRPRDVGGTVSKSLRKYIQHGDPLFSGAVDDWSAANGSLMRTVPVGLARRPDDPRLIIEARQLSAITHGLEMCQDACSAYSMMVSCLVEGMPIADVISRGLSATEHPEVALAIQQAIECESLHDLPPPAGGYVLHALRMAVWPLVRGSSFEQSLVEVVSCGGDADTNGAIAGGLLGACYGADEIPERWINKLEYADEIMDLCDDLYAIRSAV